MTDYALTALAVAGLLAIPYVACRLRGHRRSPDGRPFYDGRWR